jgi:hypothetical protein
MRPSLDRNRASASKTFKTAPKERGVEHTTPEREGSRSPVKTRPPKEQPNPLPSPAVPPAEVEAEDVAPQVKPDAVPPTLAPSKPAYVVSEGDPAFGKASTVHFSTTHRAFVSIVATTAEAADYSEDTPSSTPDAHTLEKLEKERKNRQNLASGPADASTTSAAVATEKLRNSLSFIDRAVQTNHWPAKERGTSAQSQALQDASGSCSAWEIYDAYVTNTPATAPTASSSATGDGEAAAAPLSNINRQPPSPEHARHYITRVMQRMIYQNLNPDIPADFKVRKTALNFLNFCFRL